MQIYDLDLNEEIDLLKFGEKEYQIGDIPPQIVQEISKIPTVFISDKAFINKWAIVIEKILKIKNKDVDMSNFSIKHIEKIIKIISNKINND